MTNCTPDLLVLEMKHTSEFITITSRAGQKN